MQYKYSYFFKKLRIGGPLSASTKSSGKQKRFALLTRANRFEFFRQNFYYRS
jgi:hypothetical protein